MVHILLGTRTLSLDESMVCDRSGINQKDMHINNYKKWKSANRTIIVNGDNHLLLQICCNIVYVLRNKTRAALIWGLVFE